MGFFSKIKETLVGKSAKQNDKYVAGLDKSGSSFSDKINSLAARYREIDDDYFEELETSKLKFTPKPHQHSATVWIVTTCWTPVRKLWVQRAVCKGDIENPEPS